MQSWKGYLMIVGGISATLTMVVGVMNFWTDYGWVMSRDYEKDRAEWVSRGTPALQRHLLVFEDHLQEQDELNATGQDIQNEILAYVKYVPQLEGLLRNRCMGGNVPQQTIQDLRDTINVLTQGSYQEPDCDRLVIEP